METVIFHREVGGGAGKGGKSEVVLRENLPDPPVRLCNFPMNSSDII